MNITANQTVHLSGNGVYIFRSAALNAFADTNFSLEDGACAGNVFFAPTGTFLGNNSRFVGTILDDGGITFDINATLTGRALVDNLLTVTLNTNNTITVPGGCGAVAPVTGEPGTGTTPVPTLPSWAMMMLAALLALAGFATLRRQVR